MFTLEKEGDKMEIKDKNKKEIKENVEKDKKEEVEKVKEIKKYELLGESLRAVSTNVINLLVLKGLAGFGKSFATRNYLDKEKVNYEYISTYSTPLSFYKLLYQNRKKQVIVFDDLQSINDPKIITMLKSACWSTTGKRTLNYYSTSSILNKEGLPEFFVLDANIILIFNDDILGFEPILDRGIALDFHFSFKEKLKVLKAFQEKAKIEEDVLKFVEENCNEANKNISIRSLVILSDLKRGGYNFKDFAEEILKVNTEIQDLINMSESKWINETGQSRRTYYRKRKKNNIKNRKNENIY